MPRRRNTYLSDGSDTDASGSGGSEGAYNSQEDEDSKAERALFEHNGRKRRKMLGRSGKDSAWEGIFGPDEEEGRQGVQGIGLKRQGRGGILGRADWTKWVVSRRIMTFADNRGHCRAPTFVSTSSKPITTEATPPSPRVKDADYDEEESPRGRMGLGSKNVARQEAAPIIVAAESNDVKPKGGRGGTGLADKGRAGIGSTGRAGVYTERSSTPSTVQKGGIGSSDAPPNPIAEHASAPLSPLVFGRRPIPGLSNDDPRLQQSFKGVGVPQPTAKPINLTAKEATHFRSIGSTFGARYLANLGWNAGEGLGVNRDGRAVPIEPGKILRGQGIQAGVRTEDSKRDARRRGEIFSDDEDEEPKRRGRKGPQAGPSRASPEPDQSWKKQRKVKVKVEHKTYEQLVAEVGATASAGIGLVLDARGGEVSAAHLVSEGC